MIHYLFSRFNIVDNGEDEELERIIIGKKII